MYAIMFYRKLNEIAYTVFFIVVISSTTYSLLKLIFPDPDDCLLVS